MGKETQLSHLPTQLETFIILYSANIDLSKNYIAQKNGFLRETSPLGMGFKFSYFFKPTVFS